MLVGKFRVLLPLLCLGLSGVAHAGQDGVTTKISYMGEFVSNMDGGLKEHSTYLRTGNLSVVVNTEQAGLWQDGTWFIEGIHNHGLNPSTFIGDIQTVSNIADGTRTRLQQFWYQHEINNYSSVLLGLHDLNSEYYVSEYAALFLNSSFGIGPDISGNVTTSLWPEAGYALHVNVYNEQAYIHASVYDGDSSTRQIDISNEGLMWIAEAAYLQGESAYKLGLWTHTADKSAPNGIIHDFNVGVYTVVDQAISDRFGVFLQLGLTPADRNEISNYFGFGLHMQGLVSGRDKDMFGIAIARAGFSSLYQNTHNLTSAETAVEITYDMAMTDYLNIHPAFQWIQHPGGDSTLKTAYVAMLRFELHLP